MILELLCGTFPELSNPFHILLPSDHPRLCDHRITHSVLNSDVCVANVLLLKLDVSSGTSTHWLHFLATKETVFLLSPAYQNRKISPSDSSVSYLLSPCNGQSLPVNTGMQTGRWPVPSYAIAFAIQALSIFSLPVLGWLSFWTCYSFLD